MEVVPHATLAVWSCGACKGTWAPGPILAAALGPAHRNLVRAAGTARPSARSLRCAKCDAEPLREVTTPDITIDACARCGGVYFDPGEIELFRKRQGLTRANVIVDFVTSLPDLLQVLLHIGS